MMPTTNTAIEVDEKSFESAVIARSHQLPVLVDFWADWCAPCRSLMPVLDKIVAELDGKVVLAKVNTDTEQGLAAAFAVRSLPTVKLFRNGVVVDEFLGAQPESAIRAMLEPHIDRASDRLREQAADARAAGDSEAAARLLRDALEEDPDNWRIHPELIDVCLELGYLETAAEILRAVPAKADDERIDGLRARLRLAEQSADGQPDEAALRATLAHDPDNCASRIQLSACLTARGDYEGALEELLASLRTDRNFGDGAARKAMIDIFQVLGNSGPVVSHYRGMLAGVLH